MLLYTLHNAMQHRRMTLAPVVPRKSPDQHVRRIPSVPFRGVLLIALMSCWFTCANYITVGHVRPTCYSLLLLGFWEGRKLSAAKTLRRRAPSWHTRGMLVVRVVCISCTAAQERILWS